MMNHDELTPVPSNMTEGQLIRQELRDHTAEDRSSFSGLHKRVAEVQRFMYVLMGIGVASSIVVAAVMWSAKASIKEAVSESVAGLADNVSDIKVSVGSLATSAKSADKERNENRARILELEKKPRGRH